MTDEGELPLDYGLDRVLIQNTERERRRALASER